MYIEDVTTLDSISSKKVYLLAGNTAECSMNNSAISGTVLFKGRVKASFEVELYGCVASKLSGGKIIGREAEIYPMLDTLAVTVEKDGVTQDVTDEQLIEIKTVVYSFISDLAERLEDEWYAMP